MCSSTSTASCWTMRILREAVLVDLLEQAAHAGRMHFEREIVVLGMRRGDRRGGLAHAETDLQDARRAPAENRLEIERCRDVRRCRSAAAARRARAAARWRRGPGAGRSCGRGDRRLVIATMARRCAPFRSRRAHRRRVIERCARAIRPAVGELGVAE